MIEIKLTQEEIWKCIMFAHERSLHCTKLYTARGGFKYIDILCGAMGEMAVWKWLKETRKSISEPDFSILDPKDKSYECDLKDRTRNYHVKSQTYTSRDRYGESWLLQKKDPILSEPSNKDYLVLTNVHTFSGIITIHGMWQVSNILDKIGEPKVPSFRATKAAIYLEDINA